MAPFKGSCLLLALFLMISCGQLRRFGGTNSRLDLLKKIVQTTNEDGNDAGNNILDRLGERRPTSILDRVKNRPKLPHFRSSKSKNLRRPFSPSITRGSQRNSLSDSECEELKNENDILKQLVESVNKQRAEEAKAEISKVAINQDPLAPLSQPNPLSLLSEALKISLGLSATPPLPQAIPGVHDRGIRRVESKPETSTVLQTTSYETEVTSHLTKDISLRFQGKWKTTQVVDTIIETSTITEVLTTVITATTPIPLPRQLNTLDHNEPSEKEWKRPVSNRRFRPNITPRTPQVNIKKFRPHNRPEISRTTESSQRLDSFQTLKGYLKSIKQKQSIGSQGLHRPRKYTVDRSEDQTFQPKEVSENSGRTNLFGSKDLLKEKILDSARKREEAKKDQTTTSPAPPPAPEPLPAPQQTPTVDALSPDKEPEVEKTSVVTVYLSGKVPGVYSTSLKTVIIESASPSQAREKRHAAGLIQPTKTLKIEEDSTNSNGYWDLIIEGSFEDSVEPQCKDHTVTVTVVETVGCQN